MLKLCSATADWSGHVRQMCQWCSFMRQLQGMLCTSQFFCPRLSFTCWQKLGIFLGSRLANLMLCLASILLMWLEAVQMQGRNVTADEYSRAGWLKSLHLSWGSHGDEEILYVVLQFWHPAVR
jgi:hypothetical protein